MFDQRVLVPPHRVTRIDTYQGHRVPQHGYYPNFGFEADTPVEIHSAGDVDEAPPGATAQNGMRQVLYYECSKCLDIVRENDIPYHRCED